MLFYQKYLPKSFEEVVGHERVVAEFQKRILENVLPQNIFFLGESGIGKGVFTKLIAKIILCSNKKDKLLPCNECSDCKSIDNEQSNIDYYTFNASNLGKDDMRDIEEISKTHSFTGKKKIINIEEFQELGSNKAAQKNILKALERKNKNVHFILTAMEDKTPKAIYNRCQVYRLAPIDSKLIAFKLKDICEKEGLEVEHDEEKATAIFTIASGSSGSLRTAISLIERAIYGNIWSKEALMEELHLMTNEHILLTIDKMLSGDGSFLIRKMNEDFFETIKQRLMLIYKATCGVELSAFEKSMVGSIHKKYSKEILQKTLEGIHSISKHYYRTPSLMEYTLLSSMGYGEVKIRRRERAD